MELSAIEARALGALIEKEITTPEYYPLSLNALVNACNQKNNREPVMQLAEDEVSDALDELRHKGLAGRDNNHRVDKFTHGVTEVFNLDRRETAALCVLLLRGPQTVGEIRGRTQRMYEFDDLDAVEHTMSRLIERGLAVRLPRQAGRKEERFVHLLGGPVTITEEAAPAERTDRLAALEEQVRELRDRLERLERLVQ